MQINILYLGPAHDWTNFSEETFELNEGATLQELIQEITTKHPALADRMSTIRLAVNHEFADVSHPLKNGDEVAVIPPVSGGQPDTWIDLTDQPIDTAAVETFVTGDPRYGGIVTFAGNTRAETHAEHGDLLRLDYEAHQVMAIKQMKKLADHAVKELGAGKVALIHRAGPVQLAEPSVYIAVASAHRHQAFTACRWLIDTLKKEVPIWKKEIWQKGCQSWVKGEAESE